MEETYYVTSKNLIRTCIFSSAKYIEKIIRAQNKNSTPNVTRISLTL